MDSRYNRQPPQQYPQHWQQTPQQYPQQQLYPQYQQQAQQPLETPFLQRKAGFLPLWLLLTVVVLLLGIAGVIAVAPIGQSGPTDNTTAHGLATNSSPPLKPTQAPASWHSIKPTHGTPALGGPISDFIGAYGAPSHVNSPYEWSWNIHNRQHISIDIHYQNSKVNYINVVNASLSDNWGYQNSIKHCIPFVPYRSKKVNDTGITSGTYEYVNFRSSQGNFVIMAVTTACVMSYGTA
jgi:hypothetical protein